MWNRQRLKCNARVLLKANYLKVVVVGLILSFLIGSGYNSDQEDCRFAGKQDGGLFFCMGNYVLFKNRILFLSCPDIKACRI